MKTYFLLLLIFFGNLVMCAQDNSVESGVSGYSLSSIHNDNNYWQKVSFKIGGGFLIPQGKLKALTGGIPVVDLGVDIPLRNRKTIGVNMQYGVPEKVNNFPFQTNNGVVETQIKSVFNAMVNFKKGIFHVKNTHLDIGLGIGISNLNTTIRNPDYKKEEDASKYESIAAFLISPGLELKQRLKNNELSLALNFHYAPYRSSKRIVEDIGSLFLVPKIMYRF